MIDNEKALIELLEDNSFDAIVVEGYDGVGKGKILNALSQHYGVVPYRPDYNLWQNHDVKKADRWKMSGFFWDIYSHFGRHAYHRPMLFDRGCISGAAYAENKEIAVTYKKLLRDMDVVHIVVMCDYSDFVEFQKSRGLVDRVYNSDWVEYLKITALITQYLNDCDLPCILYQNKFSPKEAKRLAHVCEGCGHYNYGWCRHPANNCKVNPKNKRCSLSQDVEVQDMEVVQ